MMEASPSVTLQSVTKRFGEFAAVEEMDLEIGQGEFFTLLGPSGCGKTTTLRMVAGFEEPTEGQVLIEGSDVVGLPPYKRPTNTVFQSYALFPHMSVHDNVAFGLKSLTRSEAKREARLALERVGLAHYAGEYPHILSGGEQQRVALARAIAPRPSVLLMDEPFSGLDSRLREQMREETLAILHETRATCIVVTHDAEEAMRMGDNVVLLRKGRMVQSGSALDLYRAPKDILAARTFSDLNEVPARVESGMAKTVLGDFPAQGVAEGREAIACVRHSGVRLRPAGEGIPARVIDQRFLGDVAMVEVAVQGLEEPLFVRVRETDAPPVGSEIGVRVEAGGVLVFEAGNNNGTNGAI